MAEVFVSYASPDREVAFKIAAFLEEQSITCWIAPRDVPPGMEYGAAILQGIETSNALVLVLSEHSNDSQFVRKEVERAVSKVKPVLPVRIREVVPSGSLEFFISSAQWVDAWRSPMEQHLNTLAEAVRAISRGGSAVGVQSSALPAARKKRRLPVAAIAGAVAAVALLGGAGVYAWAPWKPAWQRSPASFLEGSWCTPMSSNAISRTDFKKSGPDSVNAELHFSHSTDVYRFRGKVALLPDGFEFTWTDPPDWAAAGPARHRVLDDASMLVTFAGGKAQEDIPPMTRCAPGTGG